MASHFQTRFPFFYFLLLVSVAAAAATTEEPILAKPGCNHTCGSVIIPFPFGIGRDCSLDHWFEIECRRQQASPYSNGSTIELPFLSKLDIEVIRVDLPDFSSYFPPTLKVRMHPLNSCIADTHLQQLGGIDLRASPYSYSTFENLFVMEGCPHSVVLFDESKNFITQCGTVCHSDTLRKMLRDSLLPNKFSYSVSQNLNQETSLKLNKLRHEDMTNLPVEKQERRPEMRRSGGEVVGGEAEKQKRRSGMSRSRGKAVKQEKRLEISKSGGEAARAEAEKMSETIG
ncbi:hypothetical protein V2J09_007759 [Rumex salicifolius]